MNRNGPTAWRDAAGSRRRTINPPPRSLPWPLMTSMIGIGLPFDRGYLSTQSLQREVEAHAEPAVAGDDVLQLELGHRHPEIRLAALEIPAQLGAQVRSEQRRQLLAQQRLEACT